ncbi:hypothetical protein P8452_47872 [Trifolium repens]|nr:hypothetical protein P8452_47872 [Trifolium repens]
MYDTFVCYRPRQQVTFSSLLNGDYDALEEQMLLELQSTFPKHQESIGQQVQELGPINSKRVAEESDPTLTRRQLVLALRAIPSKDIMVSRKNLNTSLGKQPKIMLRGNERNLKRVSIKVGESSSSKHQKKDSPVASFVANDGIKEKKHNNSNPSSKPITPIMNAVYDPKFETMGLPIDPHIRFLKYMQDGPTGDWYKKFM